MHDCSQIGSGSLSGEREIGCRFAVSDPSTLARLTFFRRRLPIQSEFSVLKTNLMAVRRIVAIFWLALACSSIIRFECCGHPAWRWANSQM
jgi:hypothetical protein